MTDQTKNGTEIVVVVDPALEPQPPLIEKGAYAECPWPCCPTCGQPEGECYRICPEHPSYYSAEQERADEAWYAQQCKWDREQELLDEHRDQLEAWLAKPEHMRHWSTAPVHPVASGRVAPIDPEDIPF